MAIIQTIKRFFKGPTRLEKKLNMSIDPRQYVRTTGKPTVYGRAPLRGSLSERASRIIKTPGVSTALLVGATVIPGGRLASRGVTALSSASRGVTALSTLGRGLGTVARFLAPSFKPSVVIPRAVGYEALMTAYRGSKAIEKGELPTQQDIFKDLVTAPFVGIFPPAALLGGLVGKGQKGIQTIGNQFSEIYQSFNPPGVSTSTSGEGFIYRIVNQPEINITTPGAPNYYGGETSFVAPSSSTSVTVAGGGGDFGMLSFILAGGLGAGLGYLLGRKRKRKRYKGARRRKRNEKSVRNRRR